MKTEWMRKRRYPWLLFALLMGFLLLSVPELTSAQTTPPPEKKTSFISNPAAKRGMEYGFDKGFQAGKADKDGGLKPDPARHEDYNDPEKFFRSEFGSRAAFAQGFKSGFFGGYQKAFGKNVKMKIPGEKAVGSGEGVPAAGTTGSTSSDAF